MNGVLKPYTYLTCSDLLRCLHFQILIFLSLWRKRNHVNSPIEIQAEEVFNDIEQGGAEIDHCPGLLFISNQPSFIRTAQSLSKVVAEYPGYCEVDEQ